MAVRTYETMEREMTDERRRRPPAEAAAHSPAMGRDVLTALLEPVQDRVEIEDASVAELAEADTEIVTDDALEQEDIEPSDALEQPEQLDLGMDIPETDTRAIFDAIAMDDTIGLYFREVGQVPLLTAEEEIELAKRMEAGRQAQAALKREDLSPEEQAELAATVEDGLAAREHLIRANARLVISIANKYVGRGVPLLDLIQEGSIGLIRTADKFDYRKGNRFSTYATWWIRQAVTRAIADQGRIIRVPVHKGDLINKLRRTAHRLAQVVGREPTLEELADAMDMPRQKVEEIIRIARRPLSLTAPIDEEGESELGDFIEDQDNQPPDDVATTSVLRETVQGVLEDLPPRELRILQLRYGLLDGQPRTLEQVGRKLGVSRERVRQIEAQALSRLRHPARLRRLKGFLN